MKFSSKFSSANPPDKPWCAEWNPLPRLLPPLDIRLLLLLLLLLCIRFDDGLGDQIHASVLYSLYAMSLPIMRFIMCVKYLFRFISFSIFALLHVM